MDKKQRELVMAKLYLKNKDYKMAEKSFNEYLALNPEDVSALKLLGQVYEQINRFDKAFEMYERCYLAEPERTGVLLDICRILLMQGNCLDQDNVDPRKWLNLAIKAFPSNPIVVNFKALLSTLPSEEQVVIQKESPKKQINTNSIKNTSDDPLLKVLEKLTQVERRLETIEDKLKDLTISQKTFTTTDAKNSTKSQSIIVSTPNSILPLAPASTPVPVPASVPARVSTPAPILAQVSTPAPTSTLSSIFTPASTQTQPSKAAVTPGASLFSAALSTPTSKPGTVPAPSLFTSSTTPLFSSAPLFTPSSLPANTISTNFTPTSVEPPTTNMSFTSNAPFSFSNNLFAESLKKFDIPNTFNFSQNPTLSSSAFKPKENEKENEENEEVVQSEELPIENTCDMTPIDYKTGEEDEDIMFENRCKLFRFRDKEYKERGLGNIKVLKHRETGKGRLIMRRDAIGLVCLNCWDCSRIKQVRDNQVQLTGIDSSDGSAEATLFLVKFKLKETADTFMKLLLELFDDTNSPNTSILAGTKKPDTHQKDKVDHEERSEVELVDPKLDKDLVNKARELQLPDLFYHKLKNQEPCGGCNGCEND